MDWSRRVHAHDVAEEGVPAFLKEVANVGKACTTGDIGVPDFMQPADTQDASLAARMESR